MKLSWGGRRGEGDRLVIRKKLFTQKGVLVLEWAPLGCGHSTKPTIVQKMFAQCSQADGGIPGVVLCRIRSWT